MKRVRTVLQNTVIGKEAERQNLRGKRNRVGPYTNVTYRKWPKRSKKARSYVKTVPGLF